MATKQDGDMDDLVSRICPNIDFFERKKFKDKLLEYLTHVSVPVGWETYGYKLSEEHPTYKYHKRLLENFIEKQKLDEEKQKSASLIVTKTTPEEFIEQLKQFVKEAEQNDSFSEFCESRSSALIDLFQENFKLCGVVIRKCTYNAGHCKASVLIRVRHKPQDGHSALIEYVIDVKNESLRGYDLKVGDIVEVTQCRRKEGVAMEPEVIKCYHRDQVEIESFFNLLIATEGSTAAVTELVRCTALWEYILELPKAQYTTPMAMQILSIIDKICSSAQRNMSHTVTNLVKKFQGSAFFKSVFPDFVNETIEDGSLVQRILEYVVTAIPAAGPHVLPLAKVLMDKLVDNSSDLETAKENGRAAIVFLTKLSSIIALEVPQGREEVQALQWKDLPLLPVGKEIHEPRLKTDDLPVIRQRGPYKSEEEYLNTYFRLLREECFYKLRKGIHDFVINGDKCSSKDTTMYRVFLRGASLHHENSPTMMLLSLEYKKSESSEKSDNQLDQDFLMYGDLLCISLDSSFEKPIWGLVEHHIFNHSIVRITLCDKVNDLSEAEFITQMQEVTNKNDGAYMVQSHTFYQAFASAMEVLQHKDHVPFKEFLVDPKPKYFEPAEYLADIKSPPDWEIIFHKESLSFQEKKSPYSPLEDLQGMRMNSNFKSKLDPTQFAAVELALKTKLVLIQGPPGTGKSFVGEAIVRLLLSMQVPQSHGPILVVTYKNHALNNFLETLAKNSSPDEKIVRIGNLPEDADEKLKRLLLREVRRNWPQGLYERKRSLTGKLWALQPRVRSAYQKLAFSSIFSAEMFLEEASVDQIRSLLRDNKREPVDEEEVEIFLKKLTEGSDRGGLRSNARLLELVKNALRDWLPAQEEFDKFVSEEQEPKPKRNVAAALAKQKSKEDPEQENPSDVRDPSVEEKERLLALDKPICDEEDETIAQDVANEEQERGDSYRGTRERKLVCVDETKVIPHINLLDDVKVWDLAKEERVQLVYVLQSKFYKKACSAFHEVSSLYTEIHHQLKELRNQHDIEVMKKCHVIGMTVTGATMRANLLADIKPSVMIVEEAAEILEAQLVAVIPPSVQHLIMIGDHKQLRPVVHFNRLRKHHHLDLSLFERLVNCKLPYIQLGFQCRMRDEIVDLLRELKIYDNLQTQHELVKRNVLPACVDSSMYFWTHTNWEDESKNSHSKRNITEARKITEVAKTFCEKGGVPPSKITVLCSYRGQVTEIMKHFKQADKFAPLSDIKVTTIDSFQGQENDIILISLVRSNNKSTIGYLSSMNRLCVAISRARCGLYLFGNHAHLATLSKRGWKVIIDSMRKKQCLGRAFPFCSGDDVGGDRYQGSLPSRDENRGSNITIHAEHVIVGGGNGSVNTMNVGRAHEKEEVPYYTSRKDLADEEDATVDTAEDQKTLIKRGKIGVEEDTWYLREAGASIKLCSGAVQQPMPFTCKCSLWNPRTLSPPIAGDEILVSSVIELSHDGPPDMEYRESVEGLSFTVALLHSAPDLEGYEVVIKQLTDQENNEWKELKTENTWHGSGTSTVPRWLFPCAQAVSTKAGVSSFAAIWRPQSFIFSRGTAVGQELTCIVPNFPDVSVQIPQSCVPVNQDFCVTIKVQEFPSSELKGEGGLVGPALFISGSQNVTLIAPVTINIPLTLRKGKQELAELCPGELRILHCESTVEPHDWKDITDQLDEPPHLVDGKVQFKVRHFSGFRSVKLIRPLLQSASRFREFVGKLSSRSRPQRARFLTCLCETHVPGHFGLKLFCYPPRLQYEVDRKISACIVSYTGESNSYEPVCDEEIILVSLSEAIKPQSTDEKNALNFVRFRKNEIFDTGGEVCIGSERAPGVKFFDQSHELLGNVTMVLACQAWRPSERAQEMPQSHRNIQSSVDVDSLHEHRKKLHVTLLATEWCSAKGGLSTVNRVLAKQFSSNPNVKVTLFAPPFECECKEKDKVEAFKCDINIEEADGRMANSTDRLNWLAFPPEKLHIDVVIGHGWKLGWQAEMIRRSHLCKWVQMVHTCPEELAMHKICDTPFFRGEKKHASEVSLCKKADLVVAVGPKLKEAIAKSLRPCEEEKTVLSITPGVFSEFECVKTHVADLEKFYILVFGRCDPKDWSIKGYDIAAKAVAILRQRSFHLTITGATADNQEKLVEMLVSCGIPRCQLTVRKFCEDREYLIKSLPEFDLVLMPSRSEGFGLTALEALSAGIPFLVSGNSGFAEALKKVKFGEFYIVEDFEDANEWAKKIEAIRQKEGRLRLEEILQLRTFYEEKYSWESQCQDLVVTMSNMAYAEPLRLKWKK